jgi:hypothetical protein
MRRLSHFLVQTHRLSGQSAIKALRGGNQDGLAYFRCGVALWSC